MKEERDKGEAPRARRLIKAAGVLAVVLAVVLAALILSLPYLVTLVPLPMIELDLTPHLGKKVASIVPSKKVTVSLDVRRGAGGGYRIHADGQILGWPYHASGHVRFGFWRAKGDVALSLDRTTWRMNADFDVRGTKEWSFRASVPELRIDQDDRLVAPFLAQLDGQAVSNLVFAGSLALEAEGASTRARPVPSWSVKGAVRGVDARLFAGGRDVRVENLRVRFGAQGIADHVDVAPLNPRADAVEFAGFALSKVSASIRATESSYLVTEAGASCCGGELKLYSLFLNPERLTAGATVFVDGVDAGEVLAHVAAFKGDASGRLHGKLPFFLKDGRTLRLKDAYLFSPPGETGVVRVSDATPIVDNLALAGVDTSTRANLEKALANLTYSVLRVELRRGARGEDSALALRLEGSATQGRATVPVKLNVTFHGDLDQLVNTGMNLTRRQIR